MLLPCFIIEIGQDMREHHVVIFQEPHFSDVLRNDCIQCSQKVVIVIDCCQRFVVRNYISTRNECITNLSADFECFILGNGTLSTLTEGGFPGFFISAIKQIIFVCGTSGNAAKLSVLGIKLQCVAQTSIIHAEENIAQQIFVRETAQPLRRI